MFLAAETTVTLSFDPSQIITWVIIGLIAGVLASIIMRGHRYGLIISVIVGLIGALIGGFLYNLFNLSRVTAPWLLDGLTIQFRWIDILIALIGAIILLAVMSLVFRRRI